MPTRPIAGQTFTFELDLVSQLNTKLFQTPPTIASGDIRRSINGAAFANLDNLPTVTPSGTAQVQIVLSAAETTAAGAGGRIKIDAVDVAGAEWCSVSLLWFVYATENDNLATQATANLIKAKTDNLPSDPADASDIAALIATIPAGVTAAQVWANPTRTLTQAAAQLQASVSGSNLHIIRAVTFSATLSGINLPAGWDKLYFTVKRSLSHLDSEALVQILLSNPALGTDGLLVIDQAAATVGQAAWGTLVVVGDAVTISLADDATALLTAGDGGAYDLKAIVDSASVLLAAGNATVAGTPTATV